MTDELYKGFLMLDSIQPDKVSKVRQAGNWLFYFNQRLDDAKAKCDQINAETAATVEKQKVDGYAEADKLVEQAGNPIAKIAAKKAAEVAKKKVDEKCEKTKADGEAKCAKSMEDAKARAAAKAAVQSTPSGSYNKV